MRTFYVTLIVSIALIVGGFIVPPTGVIDGSVLTAVGELVIFSVIAQVPSIIEAAKNGKSIRVKKGDFSAEVNSSEDKDI